MLSAVADTHTLIWYLFRGNRLSKAAGAAIEEAAAAGDQVGFSSVSLAEIIYLIEKGRINAATLDRLLTAIDQKDAVLAEVPFDRHIALALRAVDKSKVPDLPDRIIAATAVHLKLPLISRDRKVQLANLNVIW